MRSTVRILTVLFAASVIAVAWPAPAAAQSAGSPIDVSAGYQLLHIPDETFPFGLNFDVGYGVTPTIRFVAEAGYSRDQNGNGAAGSLAFYNFGAGARWTAPKYGQLAPFAQLLLGGVHSSASLSQNPFSASATAFMIQPGVGVSYPLVNAVSILGQLDYRRAFFSPSSENEFRFVAGVRFGVR